MVVGKDKAEAVFQSPVPVKQASLHYTPNSGPWQNREWITQPAAVKEDRITAFLPAARPLVLYLSATDERGLRVSTQHEELPAGSP
jgi:hypothetical protein